VRVVRVRVHVCARVVGEHAERWGDLGEGLGFRHLGEGLGFRHLGEGA
jgi:hypothetical protein